MEFLEIELVVRRAYHLTNKVRHFNNNNNNNINNNNKYIVQIFYEQHGLSASEKNEVNGLRAKGWCIITKLYSFCAYLRTKSILFNLLPSMLLRLMCPLTTTNLGGSSNCSNYFEKCLFILLSFKLISSSVKEDQRLPSIFYRKIMYLRPLLKFQYLH